MDNLIINRFKSFAWRFAAYIITVALAWLADNVGLLELNPFFTTLIGLALGEISKYWATRQASFGKTFFGRKQ